jgi:signal peptidase I
LNANRVDFLDLSLELLERGASLRFRAHGASMHPFIKNGNILIVEPVNDSPLDVGDIVFYRRSNNALTAHRLIKVENSPGGTVFLTKGDSLGFIDPPVPPAQVLGRVIQIEGNSKQLALTGWQRRIFGRFIALSARGRYANQGRVVRNLGRIWWLIGGRRLK